MCSGTRQPKCNSRSLDRVTPPQWTFLSNHGHVIVALGRDREARMRDVAQAVGITERAVQQIVRDLVDGGYLRKTKGGRRNHYAVVRKAHLSAHELESRLTVGEFLDLVVPRARARESGRGP